MSFFEELEDIDRRISRLERLVFQLYTDVQKVAEYAYVNVRQEVTAEEIQRLEGFNKLQDKEALGVGLMFHELAALKQSSRVLRKQARQDSLTLIRDLIRPKRKPVERSELTPAGSGTGTSVLSRMPNGAPSPEAVER